LAEPGLRRHTMIGTQTSSALETAIGTIMTAPD
jgi:hypothetical protein